MHDQLRDGRCIWLFDLPDGFNRATLGIDVDFSLAVEHVTISLEKVISGMSRPGVIR